MKRLVIIISAMLVLNCMAHAQTPGAKETAWENNDSKTVSKPANEFAGTEMSMQNGQVMFSGLPDLTKAIWAVVSDSKGEVIKQVKVSPQSNTMDIHNLHSGELYFVTLMYKNKSKKGFTLNR